jgi:hypothetical protein
MKKYIMLFSVVVYSINSLAQYDLNINYNSTHSGRNVALTLSKEFNHNNEIGFAIRYNVNRLKHSDDQGNMFLKRLYATEFIQHYGIIGYYHHGIFNRLDCVKPFLFYDAQATYSTTRNRMFIPWDYDINGDVLYKEMIEIFGPFTWIEQCVGIGIKANIINSFYITQKIGFGVSFILGKEVKLLGTYDKFEWEFGGLINVGIGYRL